MLKGARDVIKKLIKIRKSGKEIDILTIQYSFDWIIEKANTLLDARKTNDFDPNTLIRESWNTQIEFQANRVVGRLTNTAEEAVWAEFGIGEVGQNTPHVKSQEVGYQYNIGDKIDEDGYWTFQLPNGRFLTFRGYIGKSFLYSAILEYRIQNIWLKKYQQAFDKVIGGICNG